MKRIFKVMRKDSETILMRNRIEIGIMSSLERWLEDQSGHKLTVSTTPFKGALVFTRAHQHFHGLDDDWTAGDTRIVLCREGVRKYFGRLPKRLYMKVA